MSKERPILFTGGMVRAIFEGRKTQTRRIIKNAAGSFWDHGAYKPVVRGGGIFGWQDQGSRLYTKGNGAPCPSCPFGQPGDLLWVRETWARGWAFGGELCAFYRADGTGLVGSESRPVAKVKAGEYGIPSVGPDATAPINCKWKPSIHMPRWASRLTLEIVKVRVERLQAISEEDALADGGLEYKKCPVHCSPRMSFADLWQSVHGHESWDANPWVWVIEFKKEVGK